MQFDKCLQPLGTFTAAGVGTWTSNSIQPNGSVALLAIDIASVVSTPSVTIFLDTNDGTNWIPLNSVTLATITPTTATTYGYALGPGTANGAYIFGLKCRLRLVVAGVGSSITGSATLIFNGN